MSVSGIVVHMSFEINVFVSSANFSRELTTDESMPFIKIRNNIGPSIDPRGTPLITFCQSDYTSLMHTRCVLFVSQFSIHLLVLSVMP